MGVDVKRIKKIRRAGNSKKYTYLGCPLTRNRSPWCYRTCQPDAKDRGPCGRIAPHTLKSNVQQAIENHMKGLLAEPVAAT